MTTASILPSTGTTPPEFRRAYVPENLRPQRADDTGKRPDQPTPDEAAKTSEAKAVDRQAANEKSAVGADKDALRPSSAVPQQVPKVNSSGNTAVAVQVQESALPVSLEPEQKLETGLSDEEKAAVADLKGRDREVRAHENAHAAVGGAYAGAPSYEFTRGPDGVQYAVGGQVAIDTSEVPGDPRATLAKLEVVRSAALAPARPSGQDRAVAAAAAAKSQEAAAELAELEKQEREVDAGKSPESVSAAVDSDKEALDEQGFAASDAPLSGDAIGSAANQPTISVNLLV